MNSSQGKQTPTEQTSTGQAPTGQAPTEQAPTEQAPTEQAQVEEVRQRLAQVRSRIVDAGGDPTKVQVLAVTKGFGVWAIQAAHAAGLTQIGESYAQELVGKCRELAALNEIQMHFIGHLQTNKVRIAAEFVDVWQCLDRPSLIKELAKVPAKVIAKRNEHAHQTQTRPTSVMLQLNVSGSASQGGCPPELAGELLQQATDAGLDVVGVMAIGAQGSPAEVRASFDIVRHFADEHELAHRSIGMSGDLAQAVAAGSTMLRLGTALFGSRPQKR